MSQRLDANAATLVNVLTCDPENQSALMDVLRENTDQVIATLDGWISTTFVAAADGERIVILSQWRDPEAAQSMQADPRMAAYFPRFVALASFDSIAGTIAYARASEEGRND